MPDYFYHPSPINFLYPNSSYLIEGHVYVKQGNGSYRLSVVNYDASSTITQKDFFGAALGWTQFSHLFSVSAITSGPILKFEYTGLENSFAYFDEIYFGTNRYWENLGVLQVYPEWNLKRFNVTNKSDHRTKGGKLYSYKWGDYTRFEIDLTYVQNSKAAAINSWWATDALIYFKIYSGGVWEVNTAYLMNDNAPFAERAEPYLQYKNGRLELESF